MKKRMLTREVSVGNVKLGAGHPVRIQSMCNTHTEDVGATVEQILRLEKAGCEIIRCAIPNIEAAQAIPEIKKQIHIPMVADIQLIRFVSIRVTSVRKIAYVPLLWLRKKGISPFALASILDLLRRNW